MTDNYKNTGASGVVIKINPPIITVRAGGQELSCRMSASARTKQSDGQAPVVGDVVRFTRAADGSGQIIQILPRRNALSRRSAVPMPSARAHEQVIAANLDLIVPVFAAANPELRWRLLDRYLALAELIEAPALICITKSDLARDGRGELKPELTAALAEYQRIGYPVAVTSTVDSSGIAGLRQAMSGKLSALLGKSGVGKSSLLNALQPGLDLRVTDVNQITGKGCHTTSQAVLYTLDSGIDVIDTPGIREFGLWGVPPEDLATLFVDMRPLLGKCRFGLGCRHVDEPGCAVRRAVMDGQISPMRYQSYVRLLQE
jgi:ribosome biogenesis GTPase